MAEDGTALVETPPGRDGDPGSPARVAVVFERGGPGEAVLREGAELANAGRLLAVVTLAPQARGLRRAGGEGPYNIAVREEAACELQEARELLGAVAGRASFQVLAGCPQPNLAGWVAEHGLGLVLLPRHRLTPQGNFFVRSLRRETSAEVRVIR